MSLVRAPTAVSESMRPIGAIFPNYTSDWTIEFDQQVTFVYIKASHLYDAIHTIILYLYSSIVHQGVDI